MTKPIVTIALTGALAAAPWAQNATPAQMAGVKPDSANGTIHFQTKLGSFRVIDGMGRLEFDFTGSVLVSKLKGTATFTGAVKKEYDKNQKQVWHGRGKAVITGDWRAVQWFGRDMSGVWYGRGIIRLAGEFDRDQNTGTYWFEDPKYKENWPAGATMDVSNPNNRRGLPGDVRIRKRGGG